jgi:aminoglycoside phosphotransferase (APT) family kinase protein
VAAQQGRSLVAPIALAEAPEVSAFLNELGLGRLDPDRITSSFGRNDIWAGHTNSGQAVFVKRLVGAADDIRARVRRVRAVDELLRGARPEVPSPRCLGVDEERGLVATRLLDGAEDGSQLYDAGRITEPLSAQMGRLVGRTHGLIPSAGFDSARREPHGPAPGTLRALPLADFGRATAAELEVWRLLHGDPALADALGALAARERATALIHGDLRLDQFLLHDGTLHLTDWEECRMGDPARDIGAIAGEWLIRAIVRLSNAEPDPDGGQDAGWLVQGAVTELRQVRPQIAAFWLGYREVRGRAADDHELACTATAVAGRHLIDRLFAAASMRGRLLAVHRAAVGVARRLLTQPGQFTGVVGLGGAR